MANQEKKAFKSFDSFEEFFQQVEERPGYWIELAKLEFTREVINEMKRQQLSKGELAERLKVTPALVTRLLSGRNNFELATMVKLARALDCQFRCHLQSQGIKSQWVDTPQTVQLVQEAWEIVEQEWAQTTIEATVVAQHYHDPPTMCPQVRVVVGIEGENFTATTWVPRSFSLQYENDLSGEDWQ